MSRPILVIGLLLAVSLALYPPWRVERYERTYTSETALRSDVIAMPRRYAPTVETHVRFAFAPTIWVSGAGRSELYRGAVDTERLLTNLAFVLGLTLVFSLGAGHAARREAERRDADGRRP